MLPWFNRSLVDTTNIHNALRDRNIPLHLNTTRGLTPGLVDPSQPNGPRIPRPLLTGLGRRRGANKNEQKKKTRPGQDPHSEDEEDDEESVDEDTANESNDEDEDESSKNDDEDQGVLEDEDEDEEEEEEEEEQEQESEFLDDDRDDEIDEDLARYSVFEDPEVQRLRAQIDNIRENPPRR